MRIFYFLSLLSLSSLLLTSATSLTLPSRSAYLQSLFSSPHASTAAHLSDWFTALDVDGDAHISDQEVQHALENNKITFGESLLLNHFDRDYSGAISAEEFNMGPYELGLLELSTEMSAPTSEDELAANAFDTQTVAAAAGVPELQTEVDSHDHVMMELMHEARESAKMQVGGEKKKGGDPHAKKTKRTGKLPVSVFGVPSFADEECVMCQFFVQRIQKEIYDRLTGGTPDSSETSPNGGLQGKEVAAQALLKIRKTNGQLQKKVGGRGIVRTTTQDTVNSLCSSDRMPILFTQYCHSFKEGNTLNAVRKGLFFNIPYTEVCSTARLCRSDSYIAGMTAVHSQRISLFLNSQRGICGMLGGARDRTDARKHQLTGVICKAHPKNIV